MLYSHTVEPGTLELLKKLSSEPALVHNFLVGGTSLALQIGHRQSVDLDLLTYFEDAELAEMPLVFDDKVTWESVKKRMIEVVKKNF